jgi:MFS family permease
MNKTIQQVGSGRPRYFIVLAGIIGLFASLGIGRFALGMLLPSMGEALDLSYAQMGAVGTVNFCGYLVAVLVCGKLSDLFGARTLISLALAAVGLSMMAVGLVNHVYPVLVLYFLTGVGSGLSNVPIMALVAAWFPPAQRGRAAGLVVTGNGMGIMMAAYLVPVLTGAGFSWRLGWLSLGATATICGVICWLLIGNAAVSGRDQHVASGWSQRRDGIEVPIVRLVQCGVLYFLFGFSYVIYVTFFVTSLIQERGFSPERAGMLWSWVGVCSLASGFLFGVFSDRFGRRLGLAAIFSLQAFAYLGVSAVLPVVFIYPSLVCFGLAAWSVPAVMAALVGDMVGAARATAVFGYITFVFGIGQIAGPAVAGMAAQSTGSFSTGFLLAAVCAVGGVIVALLLPKKTVSGG